MVAYVQEYTPLSGQPIPLWHHLSGEVWLRSHYRGCRSSKMPKLLAGQGVSRTRRLLCYWTVRELGVTMISLYQLLNISVQAIGKSVIRGEKLAKANKFLLTGK